MLTDKLTGLDERRLSEAKLIAKCHEATTDREANARKPYEALIGRALTMQGSTNFTFRLDSRDAAIAQLKRQIVAYEDTNCRLVQALRKSDKKNAKLKSKVEDLRAHINVINPKPISRPKTIARDLSQEIQDYLDSPDDHQEVLAPEVEKLLIRLREYLNK
jgi:uncharacterized protein YlxW (UPF0749 family)